MKRIVATAVAVGLITANLWAQDPAAAEDARDERQKILKAADQVELIQNNTETMRIDLESLKAEVARLKEENSNLSRDMAGLKALLEKSEADRAKEREVLLSEVGKMVAANPSKPNPIPEVKKTPETTPPSTHEKGYYHTVEQGQTLSAIATAYREKGIKVTVEDIRKANSLGANDIIKPGQKLFIPKSQ